MAGFSSAIIDPIRIKAAIAAFRGSAEQMDTLRRAAETASALPLTTLSDFPVPGVPRQVYVSQAPYWWDRGDGVFERRDGQVNPGRFTDHFSALERLGNTALLLAQAGQVLEEARFSALAKEWLYAWFVNAETRMQPHLELAQSVPGQSSGRFYGIIDSLSLLKAVHACTFLDAGKDLQDALQTWFLAYVDWLTTSAFGQLAKSSTNNHAVWWHAQAAAYAAFAKRQDVVEDVLRHFVTMVLPAQLDNRGAFPEELSRADGFFYTLFLLDAWAILGEIAMSNGLGKLVWDAKNAGGHGFCEALCFLKPYLFRQEPWPYGGSMPIKGPLFCVQLASTRFSLSWLSNLNAFLAMGQARPLADSRIGLLSLLPGFANIL